MGTNISWLDWLSFLVSVVTAVIAYRFDRNQKRILEEVQRREKSIEKKMDK